MIQNTICLFSQTSIIALEKWMEEGSVDLTITRVNMLGAPGAGSVNRLLSTTFYYRPRQIHVIIIIIYKHIRECTESFLIKWMCIYFGKLFCLTFLLKLE